MNKVFLGGTCNGSTWRDKLIKMIQVPYFNPVVEDWTPECQAIEIQAKQECNVHLYVITSEMVGVFSIAEAVESAMTQRVTCILHVISNGFSQPQTKSLKAVCAMVRRYGGIAYTDLDLCRTARVLNNCWKD